MIAASMLKSRKGISDAEWNFFLRGGTVGAPEIPSSAPSVNPNPDPEWISEEQWSQILELEKISAFHGISQSFTQHAEQWSAWGTGISPHTNPLPLQWHQNLAEFQRILLLKILREETVILAVKQLIVNELGSHFLESIPFNLHNTYEDSNAHTPVIFLLSPGTDPTTYIIELSTAVGYSDKLKIISLGQGQGPLAKQTIKEARKMGFWVCCVWCVCATVFSFRVYSFFLSLPGIDIFFFFFVRSLFFYLFLFIGLFAKLPPCCVLVARVGENSRIVRQQRQESERTLSAVADKRTHSEIPG